ncbi:alkaline phosphatase family protein [Cognatishimia sp. WU-CL00825]|uniref:sulfatase-like hydrolase/transferase n=1 Tax=Cognatishimia sp. WU-CL00825 TaxID=3127658 RepID=UPI00310B8819
MNILYIMFDQLRFDYLSCAGHQSLQTPHIDRLAQMGVRFTNAYTQSPVCGAARMSAYTSRYVSSHGAQWNGHPLRVGEPTLGDHLREAGMGCWLIGKTHMNVDAKGMARLGLTPDSIIGARQAECGFDVYVRDDGLWAEGPSGPYDTKRSPYNEYLKSKGYAGENPWVDFANAGKDGDFIASGWFMENADKPANIKEEDSETPWLTTQAIEFTKQATAPWCAHVSYIKPHWPYIVPAPYHDMYGPQDIQPPVRADHELQDPHPIYQAFTNGRIGQSFAQDKVRNKVIPAYMGLIKQCDDQIGRLLDHLEASGQLETTMIILTSDHGDYLGDHWMGEKDLFHAPSVKIPAIIYDPRPEADTSRGTTCDALVEAIDLTATIIAASGRDIPDHIVEGRSLLPYLRGETPQNARAFVVSEYDYSKHPVAEGLKVSPRDARMFMVADHDWKLVHCEGNMPPMLFDLKNDPQELKDLGRDPSFENARKDMYAKLHSWGLRMSQRLTISDAEIVAQRQDKGTGVMLGLYDDQDVAPDLVARYKGRIPTDTGA